MNSFRYAIRVISLVAIGLTAASISVADDIDIDSLVLRDDKDLDRSLNGGVVSYAESLKNVRPAVVSVFSTKMVEVGGNFSDPFFRKFFGETPQQAPQPMQGMGSGVIVTANGYVLTNNHVIEDADEVKVKLEDGREYDAEVVGTDPHSDIAVLKIEESSLPHAIITDSENLQVGDVVFAIGNPLGVGQTATMGIVSAIGRNDLFMIEDGLENFIQTDASINRGNSGGALVDAHGRLVGINTMILTDGRTSGNIGIGFAVPSRLASHVMESLVERGSVSRGFLGVGIDNLTKDTAEGFGVESTKGAIITQVTPDSPADAAGLMAGDIIVKVNEEEIDSSGDLKYNIGKIDPGTDVELTIIRDAKSVSITATLVDREGNASPIDTKEDILLEGVGLAPIDEEHREKYGLDADLDGLIVTSISPDSPFASKLPEGLVIIKINGESVSGMASAKRLLKKGSKNMLLVTFRGIYRWVSIEVE